MIRQDNITGKRGGFDYTLLISTILLVTIGLFLIYSSDQAQGGTNRFQKQLILAVIGFILLGGISAVPGRIFQALSFVIYGFSFFSLILVLLLGIVGLGAQRWLAIGGIQIQPSELAKIALILLLARILSRRYNPLIGWKLVVVVFLYGTLIVLPILMQPDLGTSTVFAVIAVALLAWHGLQLNIFIQLFVPVAALFFWVSPWVVSIVTVSSFIWLWLSGVRRLGTVVLGVVTISMLFLAPFAWNLLEPYQQRRLSIFLNPSSDPLGAGYQVIQSQVAVGSGGLSGKGYLQGTQSQLKFLPEQHTDFIFALMGEEFGFIGASVVILLISIYCWRCFAIASRAKSYYMALIAVGMGTLVFYHAIINIGMAVGFLPVTGLPLPFLSYGRSFLLTCLIGTGMTLSAGLYRKV